MKIKASIVNQHLLLTIQHQRPLFREWWMLQLMFTLKYCFFRNQNSVDSYTVYQFKRQIEHFCNWWKSINPLSVHFNNLAKKKDNVMYQCGIMKLVLTLNITVFQHLTYCHEKDITWLIKSWIRIYIFKKKRSIHLAKQILLEWKNKISSKLYVLLNKFFNVNLSLFLLKIILNIHTV